MELSRVTDRVSVITQYTRWEPITMATFNMSSVAVQAFEKEGWMDFVKCLDGYNEDIVKDFVQNCRVDEEVAIIKGLKVSFSPYIITVAT